MKILISIHDISSLGTFLTITLMKKIYFEMQN